MNYRLKGGEVFDPDFVFRKHDVFIRDEKISLSPCGEFENIDITGMKLIPGLTDIHFHGCMGHDFCDGDPAVIKIMAEYEASRGITQICPATMTYTEEKLSSVMKAAAHYISDTGAHLVGINLEGPFISHEKKGAQNPEYIHAPDIEMFRRLNILSGNMIKLVALAPEVKGAEQFTDALKDETVISFAHSASDYDTAVKAFERGVHHMTHIYNAMEGINHRHPGPISAAADMETVEAEIICDGVHIHPAVVRNTIKLFTDERIIFISDSMEAAGMPDGEYELGGQKVYKTGNKAVLKDGTIAGSASDLMDCLRQAVLKMNIPLETAVKCAAVNPARSIGIYDKYGSIEEGKTANLLVTDDSLNVRMVFINGKIQKNS